MKILRLQKEPFTAAEIAPLTEGRSDIGALVTFTGLCRDEEGRLAALEIEHYPGMAEAEIERVVDEACRRWPLEGVLVIHRYGLIRPGEPIVLVATASKHRTEAFAAAQFLMDYLKTHAPFWKREHGPNGRVGDWVGAREEDEAAVRRWGG
ncbi:MAG TPA: molybdenum cofactor biosynthesis protein MoaE [Methylovirgula sp.]|nr:molybdenum cofactor biosynthesis protein MoaE [Methylovirgula sp.]